MYNKLVKQLLLLLLLFLPNWKIQAQITSGPVVPGSQTLGAVCAAGSKFYANLSTGALVSCQAGIWALVAGDGSGNVIAAGTLTADLPVVGAGSTNITVGTKSGNTNMFATTTGAQTSGRCVEIDANGNHIAASGPCGSGGAYTFGTGLQLVGSDVSIDTAVVPTKAAASTFAELQTFNKGINVASITALANAGDFSYLAGVLQYRDASGPQTLMNNPFSVRGDLVIQGASGPARLAAGASGYFLMANGAAADPSYQVPNYTQVSGAVGLIASGTKALDTDAIASEACDTMTATATGAASTDVVTFTANADITAVTGYAPETTGGLAVYIWPTTDTVNIKVCNPTSSSITPGAVSLNWRITR